MCVSYLKISFACIVQLKQTIIIRFIIFTFFTFINYVNKTLLYVGLLLTSSRCNNHCFHHRNAFKLQFSFWFSSSTCKIILNDFHLIFISPQLRSLSLLFIRHVVFQFFISFIPFGWQRNFESLFWPLLMEFLLSKVEVTEAGLAFGEFERLSFSK